MGHPDLWLKGLRGLRGTGGVAGPSAAARKMRRAFAQDDEFVWVWKIAVRAFARMPTLAAMKPRRRWVTHRGIMQRGCVRFHEGDDVAVLPVFVRDLKCLRVLSDGVEKMLFHVAGKRLGQRDVDSRSHTA